MLESDIEMTETNCRISLRHSASAWEKIPRQYKL
jgi:hypothetical protein